MSAFFGFFEVLRVEWGWWGLAVETLQGAGRALPI